MQAGPRHLPLILKVVVAGKPQPQAAHRLQKFGTPQICMQGPICSEQRRSNPDGEFPVQEEKNR